MILAKKSMISKEEHRSKKVAKGKMSKVKLRNRCSICGRPRSFYRDFGLCRIHFRTMAHEGLIPGVTKSSW